MPTLTLDEARSHLHFLAPVATENGKTVPTTPRSLRPRPSVLSATRAGCSGGWATLPTRPSRAFEPAANPPLPHTRRFRLVGWVPRLPRLSQARKLPACLTTRHRSMARFRPCAVTRSAQVSRRSGRPSQSSPPPHSSPALRTSAQKPCTLCSPSVYLSLATPLQVTIACVIFCLGALHLFVSHCCTCFIYWLDRLYFWDLIYLSHMNPGTTPSLYRHAR